MTYPELNYQGNEAHCNPQANPLPFVRKNTAQMEGMDMGAPSKTSRIDIRLLPRDKNTIETAAMMKRVSVSSYILSAAIEAAKADIEREEIVTLNDAARDMLLRMLDNPPEPPESLKRLFR